MARTAGRTAEATKQQVLDAAALLVSRHGTAASMTDIAATAGVSKGGLLYHYPSKQALLAGVATEVMDKFRRDVEQAASHELPGTPGRLTRAYIRVSFTHASDLPGLRDDIALAAHLMFEPGLEDIARADAAKWRQDLSQDGLDPAATRMIIAATDGANSAPLWGAVLSDADRDALESDLLDLTRTERTPR